MIVIQNNANGIHNKGIGDLNAIIVDINAPATIPHRIINFFTIT